jgi:hypothetical protein
MTIQGWILMAVSLGTVLLLVGFCLTKVLLLPPVEIDDMQVAPIDIDTRDREQAD